MDFFRAGATARERLMLAANRIGKTGGLGAYEATLHLTGRYPAWWEKRRFDHAIDACAAGDTAATAKEIIQEKLIGRLVRKPGDPVEAAVGLGTGMIPGDLIHSVRWRPGIPDAVETISVRHVSGGWPPSLPTNAMPEAGAFRRSVAARSIPSRNQTSSFQISKF